MSCKEKMNVMRKADIFVVSVLFLFNLSVVSYAEDSFSKENYSPTVQSTVLHVQYGMTENGYPTSVWIEAIRERHDEISLSRLQDVRKYLTSEELVWVELIRSRVPIWSEWVDSLSLPFKGIEPPDTISILLGNSGGEDAFVPYDLTIGFDLYRLLRNYGSSSTTENRKRIDRLFSHETTHVLHRIWQKNHEIDTDSPLKYALWICLVEGLGNYRSLSNKWVDTEGVLTSYAEKILADLQPLFVDRLLSLENAGEEDADHLLQGLSSGPFTQKWGALTCALWFAQEVKGNDAKLQQWVEAGPQGILILANKYLPEELRNKLSGITER